MSFKRNRFSTRSRSRSTSSSPSDDRNFGFEKTAHFLKNERKRHSSGRNSRRVYVANISFDTSIAELKEEFGSAGEVTYVQMLKDDSGRFKGCAVVTFSESYMAEDALENLNRKEFKGRKLVVREEESNPDFKRREKKRSRDDFDTAPLPMLSNTAGPLMNCDMNTHGLSMSFLTALGIELPLVNFVFVANLDYTVKSADLKDVFSLAGKVLLAEVFTDKEGKSRGFGIVEYEHPVEAVQAISMLHNQTYVERLLTVRLDRSDRSKDSKLRLPHGLKSVGMGLGVDGKALKNVNALTASNPMGLINSFANPICQVNQMGGLGAVNAQPYANQITSTVPSLMNPLGGGVALNSLGGAFSTGNFGNNAEIGRVNMSDNYSSRSSSRNKGSSLGNIILISNLPMEYNSDNLRKLCWIYGDVRLAEITSQGVGMVKFRSDADAQRAMDVLGRQSFEGRMLNVRAL